MTNIDGLLSLVNGGQMIMAKITSCFVFGVKSRPGKRIVWSTDDVVK